VTRRWVPPAVTLAVRAALALLLPAEPRWDGYFYARYARRLADGLGYVDLYPRGPRPTAFYPVGYPAALSAALRAVSAPQGAVVALNLAASLVACLAAMVLGQHLGDRRTAVRAGLVYALLPGPALWCLAAMTETLTGALLALGVTLLVHGWNTRPADAPPPSPAAGPFVAVLGGFVLGLAALVRPPSLGLLVAPLALRGPWARRVAFTLLLGLGAGLAVGPWTARNCARLDACALVSTNGGSNLLIGTFSDAHGGYRRPVAADGCEEVRGEVARDRCMSARARRRIVAQPGAWLVNSAWKLAITFGWEHDPVSYVSPWPLQRWPSRGALAAVALCTLSWWALVALSLRGARARLDHPVTRAVAVAALGLVATHALFLGADRYHLVLAPLLAPLAALAWRPRVADGPASQAC
jgi:4-amino-4-deoxy-L-arabinose transferase-like glycosyltransferase